MVYSVPDMPGLDVVQTEGLEDSDGHIQLEGLPNTRDLGGIPVEGGKQIKQGRLIRSGELSSATESDKEVLVKTYDVRTVIDLRTEQERHEKPEPEDGLIGVRFVNAPVLSMSAMGITREGGIKNAIKTLRAMQSDPVKAMAGIYPKMVLDKESQEGLTTFFDEVLATPEGAVLWHCTAGKDRAGLAAMLMLHVLGASREDIMKNYLATNRYLQDQSQRIADALEAYGLAKALESSIHILNSADPQFMQAAFDAIESEYGSIDDYVEHALGITEEKRQVLKDRYLEVR